MATNPGIRISYINTKQQIADILTKGMFTALQFQSLSRQSMLMSKQACDIKTKSKTTSNHITSSKFPKLLGSRNFLSSTQAPFYVIGSSAAILSQGPDDSSLTFTRDTAMHTQEVRGLLAMSSDDRSTALAGGLPFSPPPPTPAVPLGVHCNRLLIEAGQLLHDASTTWRLENPGQPEVRYFRTSFDEPIVPGQPEGGLSMDNNWSPHVISTLSTAQETERANEILNIWTGAILMRVEDLAVLQQSFGDMQESKNIDNYTPRTAAVCLRDRLLMFQKTYSNCLQPGQLIKNLDFIALGELENWFPYSPLGKEPGATRGCLAPTVMNKTII